MPGSSPLPWSGRVTAGKNAGLRVRVEDDADATGGLLILLCDPDNPGVGWDDRVEEAGHLDGFFVRSGWCVCRDDPIDRPGPVPS
ncbi:hypothetical protein TA3x_005133 [Tundrisphaera sp. TA3]|uniref:hypothetical protein n=1 Tax=Tundrisphaera sp. TA3 TaxID=3435775 RepID=UPI003EB70305